MTSLVLGDLIPKSLTPSVNAPLDNCNNLGEECSVNGDHLPQHNFLLQACLKDFV